MIEIGIDGWIIVATFVGVVVLLGLCAWLGRRERRGWAGIENEDRLA